MKLLFSIIFLIFSINSVFSKNETIVLTPFRDSKCTQVGGGIGYGYMPELTSMNSNLIQVFGNFYDLLDFSESTKSDQLKMSVLGSNGKPYVTEIFDFNTCQYSTYFKGYYLVELNADLPKNSLQFNVWSKSGSFGDPCSIDNYQNFTFVTNGTTVDYDNQSSTQEFTCVEGIPYITVCGDNSNSCNTNHLTTCFDAQYKATCIN
ncbi:hypothetical protein ACTFIR_010692 [Dictyostelium discoideum]